MNQCRMCDIPYDSIIGSFQVVIIKRGNRQAIPDNKCLFYVVGGHT